MTQKVSKESKKSRTFPGKVHKRVGRTAPLGYAPALRTGAFGEAPREHFNAPTQSRSNFGVACKRVSAAGSYIEKNWAFVKRYLSLWFVFPQKKGGSGLSLWFFLSWRKAGTGLQRSGAPDSAKNNSQIILM